MQTPVYDQITKSCLLHSHVDKEQKFNKKNVCSFFVLFSVLLFLLSVSMLKGCSFNILDGSLLGRCLSTLPVGLMEIELISSGLAPHALLCTLYTSGSNVYNDMDNYIKCIYRVMEIQLISYGFGPQALHCTLCWIKTYNFIFFVQPFLETKSQKRTLH